jgi:multicomponent Na+:H+ antiporter subunit G
VCAADHLGLIQAGLAPGQHQAALILLFLLFTAPTASHALARAAMVDGKRRATGPDNDSGEPTSKS